MKNSDFVTKWVLDTIRGQYADDIALVVSHTTLRINDGEKAMSYFVPITKRGSDFNQTFILSGEGFDIWGIEWERLEKFANLEEYNITCLADGEVLYARTPADAHRFEALKKQQKENLADGTLMRKCALEAYSQAKDIYLEMLFSQGSDVRLGAGYVLDYLARAIAFTNLTYFKKSQTAQLEELQTMKNVPQNFSNQYLQVIMERSEEIQKKLCYELILTMQKFLSENALPSELSSIQRRECNFQDLADWYAELSYTWLRIRHYAQERDSVKVYMWGIMLQEELNNVCADFGLEKMELMTAYDPDNLSAFVGCSDKYESEMRAIIEDGGGIIKEFKDFEEFLDEI
jgi:hypothetical protein